MLLKSLFDDLPNPNLPADAIAYGKERTICRNFCKRPCPFQRRFGLPLVFPLVTEISPPAQIGDIHGLKFSSAANGPLPISGFDLILQMRQRQSPIATLSLCRQPSLNLQCVSGAWMARWHALSFAEMINSTSCSAIQAVRAFSNVIPPCGNRSPKCLNRLYHFAACLVA